MNKNKTFKDCLLYTSRCVQETGIKQPTGAGCELLLRRQVKGDQWECLAKPGKRMQVCTKVSFGDGSLTAVVDETLEDGNKYVTFY